jgi:hypothetical protein
MLSKKYENKFEAVEINFLKRREEKLEGQNQGYFK